MLLKMFQNKYEKVLLYFSVIMVGILYMTMRFVNHQELQCRQECYASNTTCEIYHNRSDSNHIFNIHMRGIPHTYVKVSYNYDRDLYNFRGISLFPNMSYMEAECYMYNKLSSKYDFKGPHKLCDEGCDILDCVLDI